MHLCACGILRYEKNLGPAQSDGTIEADVAEPIGLDYAGQAQRAGCGKAGMNANLIVALFQLHRIGAEYFSFGADLHRARNRGGRSDAQVDRELLTCKCDGGDRNGLEAQAGLWSARERDRINRNPETLRLPGRARDAACVFLAIGHQYDSWN